MKTKKKKDDHKHLKLFLLHMSGSIGMTIGTIGVLFTVINYQAGFIQKNLYIFLLILCLCGIIAGLSNIIEYGYNYRIYEEKGEI